MTTVTTEFPFQNPDLPRYERIHDLISRLTVEEKIAQLSHGARAVPRLGLPEYNYLNEALHGVARNGRATIFPQAIGMAATWNPDLIRKVASAIGDEARAKYHYAVRKNGHSAMYQGLTLWSPNINIFRDPRWGRGQETWGEDPYLTGEMGSAFVEGLQGDDPNYLKAAACAKHFAVHSGPEKDRHIFDAQVSRQDLHDTYLPAFKKLVTQAKVEAVMGAYNRLYGEPCCASQLLLNDLLRGEWGFDGHVVSDCGALGDFHLQHKVTNDAAESAALAVRMGCDVGCDHVYESIPEALERGLITEADLDTLLFRSLRARFRLGMFDPSERVPYSDTPMSVVGSKKHRLLAYEAASESVVLLKNKNNTLPVKPSVKSILIVGPNAASTDVLMGNYYGLSENLTTMLAGLVGAAPEGLKMEYKHGCLLNTPRPNKADVSEAIAAEVDLIVACMGISPLMEGEENDALLTPSNGDRTDIHLPQNQITYLKRLAASGTPIALVLNAGSPLILGEAEELADAILYTWYPGQEGGRAVADVVFGKVNPSGRLPLSFPKSMDDLPAFDDYSMERRTYRYSEVEPAFPFGFGLSYTRFEYSKVESQTSTIKRGESYRFQVKIKNIGERKGKEVVQVYLQDVEASTRVPRWKLVAFRNMSITAGKSVTLDFELGTDELQFIHEDGKPCLETGRFRVRVGGSSPSQRATMESVPSVEFKLELV
jgi:beta-glucosidase